MRLEEIRPSFTVYVVSRGYLDTCVDTLEYSGYAVQSYEDAGSALGDVVHNPPHVFIFEADDLEAGDVARLIARVHELLPETHVILAAPFARRPQLVDLLESGAYDLIFTPFAAPAELLRAVDRAAERDYFMYLNERAEVEAAPPAPVASVVSAPEAAPPDPSYAREIFGRKTIDDCVALFLERVGGGVFFRYVANRRTLLAAVARGVNVEISNLGLDLNQASDGFRVRQLRAPAEIPAFRQMITDVFGATDFFTRTLDCGTECLGVFVFLNRAEGDASLDEHLLLLDRAVGLLESEKRLHVAQVRDVATDVLARPHFVARITQEVSRARRLSLPVSLLILAFDQFDLVGSEVGTEEAELILRTIARLCERHSRVNDVIGRTGPAELGLLLPHTGRRGALIKAERLRRALNQADFSKVVRTHPRVSVSIGVSEYPSLTRDAEELFNAADETLYHLRQRGNRVGVAEPPTGLTPDFVVSDEGS